MVGFVFVFASDFVIHTIWLMPDYNATKSLWRSEAEMASHFPWMLGAQLLCAATFVLIWALGFASRGTVALALTYGMLMGLFTNVNTIISYVVTPLPGTIALKWFSSALVQCALLSLLTYLVYKPERSSM